MNFKIQLKHFFTTFLATVLLLSWAACKNDDDPVFVDTNIPLVDFTSPQPHERSSQLRTVNFTVHAEASGDKTIDRVEFHLNDVLIDGSADNSPPFEHVREFQTGFGESLKITAYAYDNQGFSDSTSIFINVFNAVEKAAPPKMRYGFSSEVVNGKIYILGGNEPFQNLVEEYDPATNSWSVKTPSKFGHFAGASCVIDDQIYVFGGQDASSWTTNVEVYDPATDTWTDKAPIPADMGASIGINAVAYAQGKAYLIGGLVNPTPSRIAEYDPVADSWRMTDSYKQHFNGTAVTLNDEIYFMGGCFFQSLGFCGDVSDSLQLYDPVADMWINKAPMPIAHTGHASTVHNGRIFVMGGSPQHIGNPDRDIDSYDPATDSWKQHTFLPKGLINFGCESLNGKIFIIGPERLLEHTPE